MGSAWDQEEINKLLSSLQKKKAVEDIAIEHERTVGGIKSAIQKIAVEYYFNNQLSIEEIQRNTGLTPDVIQHAIKKHEAKKAMSSEIKVKKEVSTKKVTKNELSELKDEISSLKKDVKEMLRLMNALYDFETQ